MIYLYKDKKLVEEVSYTYVDKSLLTAVVADDGYVALQLDSADVPQKELKLDDLKKAKSYTEQLMLKYANTVSEIKFENNMLSEKEIKELEQERNYIEAVDYLKETQWHFIRELERGQKMPKGIKEKRDKAYAIIEKSASTEKVHKNKLNLNDSDVTADLIVELLPSDINIKEATSIVKRRERIGGFKSWNDVDRAWYIGKDDIKALQKVFEI